MEKMVDDFEMVFSFKATCAHLLDCSYMDHMEMRVLLKEMFTLDLPFVDQGKIVKKYGRSKYTLHA